MSIETLIRAAELLRESVQYRPEQYDPYFAMHKQETECVALELEAMAEHLTPRVCPGWQLVPIEPTPEMLDAVAWPNAAKTDYAHMLAAALKPEMKG